MPSSIMSSSRDSLLEDTCHSSVVSGHGSDVQLRQSPVGSLLQRRSRSQSPTMEYPSAMCTSSCAQRPSMNNPSALYSGSCSQRPSMDNPSALYSCSRPQRISVDNISALLGSSHSQRPFMENTSALYCSSHSQRPGTERLSENYLNTPHQGSTREHSPSFFRSTSPVKFFQEPSPSTYGHSSSVTFSREHSPSMCTTTTSIPSSCEHSPSSYGSTPPSKYLCDLVPKYCRDISRECSIHNSTSGYFTSPSHKSSMKAAPSRHLSDHDGEYSRTNDIASCNGATTSRYVGKPSCSKNSSPRYVSGHNHDICAPNVEACYSSYPAELASTEKVKPKKSSLKKSSSKHSNGPSHDFSSENAHSSYSNYPAERSSSDHLRVRYSENPPLSCSSDDLHCRRPRNASSASTNGTSQASHSGVSLEGSSSENLPIRYFCTANAGFVPTTGIQRIPKFDGRCCLYWPWSRSTLLNLFSKLLLYLMIVLLYCLALYALIAYASMNVFSCLTLQIVDILLLFMLFFQPDLLIYQLFQG